MKYLSLNNPSFKVNFRDAVLMGQAPEKGLFFPEQIPVVPEFILKNLNTFSKEEIAFQITQPFVGDIIDSNSLKEIVKETVNFDFPLIPINESVYALELFHGPTGAFKDVGARFLSRVLHYFSKDSNQKLTVLVATSGDTGGAVADAFFKKNNIDVYILFPSGKVSELQHTQLTCYGENIHALEVAGTFDDCQMLVKQAFDDKVLNKKFRFISANSINIARWVSQQFYYFFALQKWPHKQPPVISVPSGNLGNISAGLLAKATGLETGDFIAACNENKALTDYLQTGVFKPKETVKTISNAMDVGNPSNFKRVIECLLKDKNKSGLTSFSFTSEETKNAIQSVYLQNKYLMDPHGAVGYLALKKYLESHPGSKGIFLETAHPAKFSNIIQPIIGREPEIPKQFLKYDKSNSQSEKIKPLYQELLQHLS
ncbi:MAG: threonine synthase [Chitinophagaceae bacterium]|nr:threonine synthase [Chitinophagaceae bacterium]